jgi:hypothetical protein
VCRFAAQSVRFPYLKLLDEAARSRHRGIGEKEFLHAYTSGLIAHKRRFEEFRAARSGRSRFPETLWSAAAEMAKCYGVNRTAQLLRLEYGGLRKRAKNQLRPKAKSQKTEPAGFLEFLAPGAKPTVGG